MGEQEVIMTKLALSVTLVALAALTASSTSSAPRAAWNPSADVAALLQTSADTAGEVKLSSSGAATYAMGIPQTGPGDMGLSLQPQFQGRFLQPTPRLYWVRPCFMAKTTSPPSTRPGRSTHAHSGTAG